MVESVLLERHFFIEFSFRFGPYLNDIGHNANNANNGNQNFPLSFKYGFFSNSNFPLLFKYDNFDNIKSTLSYSFFPMSFKNGTKSSVVF